MARYVLHKIACAGGAASIIDQAALSSVHSHSQGSPRLVDNLMTNALTLGAQMEKKVSDRHGGHPGLRQQPEPWIRETDYGIQLYTKRRLPPGNLDRETHLTALAARVVRG